MLIRRKKKNSAAPSCRLHIFIDTNNFIGIQDFGSKMADTKIAVAKHVKVIVTSLFC